MKSLGIIAVVALALVIAWFILNPNNSSDFVVMVSDDITALEEELIEVEAALEAGTLTPAEANAARSRIIERVTAIEASAAASGRAELTVGQRQQLSEGLDRLKNILLTYRDTLATVEVTAAADSRVSPSRRGSSGRSLTRIVAETIESFETVVEEVVEDYESDPALDEAVDEVVEDAEAAYDEAELVLDEEDLMEDDDSLDGEAEAVEESSATTTPSEGGVDDDITVIEGEATTTVEEEVTQ